MALLTNGERSLFVRFLPLLLLTILTATTFSVLLLSRESPYENNVLSYAVLAFNYIVFFFARKYYSFTIIITYFLALFQWLPFTIYPASMTIGINNLGITFQPKIFLCAIISLLLHLRFGLWKKLFPPPTEKQVANNYERDYGIYFQNYEHFTAEKLQQIIDDDRYLPAAKAAANERLNKRSADPTSLEQKL